MQKQTISEITELSEQIININTKEENLLSTISDESYIAGMSNLINHFRNINSELKNFSKETQKPLTTSIEAILNSTLDGIIVINSERDIIMANDSFFNLCGYRAFEISGKDSTTHIAPENILSKSLIRFIKYSFDNSEININNISTGIIEISHTKPKRTLKATATPLKYSSEKLDGLVINLKDITKELEANEEKNKFVSSISHEFRTPLFSIIGYSNLIATDKDIDTENMKNFGKTIYDEALQLSDIIDNILNVLIMDREDSSIHPENLRLKDIMDNIISEYEQKAKANGLKIISNFPNDIKEIVNDKESIITIISNLLSNAIKFSTPNSNILIDIEKQESSLVVAIVNYGVGIPEDEKSKIFEKFFRVENKVHKLPGAGLGLFISKRLAGLHGGNITFESIENGKTTFYLTLPVVSKYAKDKFNLVSKN